MKWHKRFLDLARLISTWSKDPSTKCGAVITRDRFIVSVGYNGFPQGCDDSDELYTNKNRKYERVIHAEMNAILSAQQSLVGCNIYIYPVPPCARCATAIIQTGIKEIYTLEPNRSFVDRWFKSLYEGQFMCREAGVSLNYIKS